MLAKIQYIYSTYKKYIFLLILFLLLILFGKLFISNKDIIIQSLDSVREAQKLWILIALFVYFLIVPLNSFILIILSYKKLKIYLTIKEQTALLFINKVLPSGLGQVTLNSYYLYKEGNSKSQTASILTLKGFSSVMGLMLMLIFFLIVNIEKIIYYSNIFNPLLNSIGMLFIFIILIILILFIGIYLITKNKNLNLKLKNSVLDYKKEILDFKNEPLKLIFSTIFSIGILTAGFLTLLFSAKAIDINLSFSEAFFIFYFGNLVASVVPLPGGIGTTEIGLYLGFYILGFDPLFFIPAILVFRLINYWIPLFIGFLFFMNLRKNVLKSFTLNYSNNNKIKINLKNNLC